MIIAAPLVLAIYLDAASTTSTTLQLSGAEQVMSRFAAPTNVTVSSVMPTWATVRFVLPTADATAASEEVVVYSVTNGSATVASSGTVTGTQATVTGLRPSTSYIAAVSVNAVQGHAASSWTMSSEFVTAAATAATSDGSPAGATPGAATPAAGPPADSPPAATATPGVTPAQTPTAAAGTPSATSWPTFDLFPTASSTVDPSSTATGLTTGSTAATSWPASAAATATTAPPVTPSTAPATSAAATSTAAPSSTAAVPYAPALSSYNVLAQSYSATDIINAGWAQDANTTAEGGNTCPVANTTYSSALNAVVLTTAGQPSTAGSEDCAHIRSQFTVPTSGDVVESEIWLPSLSSAVTANGTTYPAGTLLDWASMWTDGANSVNGTENWPADTEVDAVETQYGANYVSVHSGSISATGGSTGTWTTEPQGWDGAGATYATPNPGAANVQPGWNVVDIEFTSTDANIYFNGALYVTVPASQLTHNPAYLDFGIGGPNGADPNSTSWPAGPATEDVAYVKVFS